MYIFSLKLSVGLSELTEESKVNYEKPRTISGGIN